MLINLYALSISLASNKVSSIPDQIELGTYAEHAELSYIKPAALDISANWEASKTGECSLLLL